MAEEHSAPEHTQAHCCQGSGKKKAPTAEGHSCHGKQDHDHAHEGCCHGKGNKHKAVASTAKAGT